MRILPLSFLALIALIACRQDETLTAYGAADKVWRLVEVNNQPYTAQVTLTFPEPGKLAGKAPCNNYFGAQTVPYPWFKAQDIGATKRSCPELAEEATYFEFLRAASLSEVLGDTLILSNDTGLSLVFKADG